MSKLNTWWTISNSIRSSKSSIPSNRWMYDYSKKSSGFFVEKKKNNRNIKLSACSDQAIIEELERRIQEKKIKFEYDKDGFEIGLICSDYQWEFPIVEEE